MFIVDYFVSVCYNETVILLHLEEMKGDESLLKFLEKPIVKDSEEKTYLTWRENLSYAVGRGAQGMSTAMMSSSFLNFFLTNVFHIKAGTSGNIRLFCGIWDAINDPVFGVIMDKTNTKFGKMRPYIMVAPFITAFFTLLFFLAPSGLSPTMGVVLAVICMVGWDMAYTAFDVPMGALAYSITPNTLERTKLFGIGGIARTILAGTVSVGMTLFMSIPYFKERTRSVYSLFAVYSAIMIIVFTRFTFHNCRERAVYSDASPSLRQCVRSLLANKPLLALIFCNLAYLLVSTVGASAMYVAVDILGGTQYMLMLEIAIFPASLVANLFVPKLMERLKGKVDHKKMFMLACSAAAVLHTVLFLICYPTVHGGGVREGGGFSIPLLIFTIFMVFAFSVPQETKNLLQKEMEAETVDYVEWKTGERPEGTTLSIMSFLGKLSNSVSSSIVLYILHLSHYTEPVGTATVAAQTPGTRVAIFSLVTLIPALGYLLMLIPAKFYSITGKKHRAMMADIAKRKEAAGLLAQADEAQQSAANMK